MQAVRREMAEVTAAIADGALELRDARPYVVQFKAHEMVYEYNKLVVRLFEGR
jgi:hypothetical protein